MNPTTPDEPRDDACDRTPAAVDTDWTWVWIVFAMMFLVLALSFG